MYDTEYYKPSIPDTVKLRSKSGLSVPVAPIKRYLKRRRETGQVQPKAIPGRPAVKGAVLQAHLQAQLETHPDVTREEHCCLFSEAYGIQVSMASISRARMALGWTRKKDDPSQRAERSSSRGVARTSQAVAYPGSGHRG